ncbi:hypothetical protein M406DRAFT_74551 [Cryphonectria parasitica EP155]|uniref:Uncharacterized protein n=1 Tax=Cryphonectria parasitica (strain ATCC 38755 / EP155) TaxID=660469 RepID=A0A9P5CL30_CRYP1|nr:uncharacterized protein M406DRAFT_74551 [Cryphonectria parasitica EP155]KAF3761601.1 hypothetical protein M406DRAFT_74551 [Cryphonectria parasitica EP155]
MISFKYLTMLVLGAALTTASPAINTARASSDAAAPYFAYGTGVNGLPLWYGDGVAYLGKFHPSNVTNSANVTLTLSDKSIKTVVNKTNSADPDVGSSLLYINTVSGAFSEVGFTNDSSTDEHTTTGFGLLGTMLVWENSKGDLDSSWYAEPVTEDQTVYKLLWNTDLVSSDTAVAVVLKKTPPPS